MTPSGTTPAMPQSAKPQHRYRPRWRDCVVALLCGGFVAVAAGLAFAALPLFLWFARTAGAGGVVQVAALQPIAHSSHMVAVRFDAKLAGRLPWLAAREQNCFDVRLGRVVTVYYGPTKAPDHDGLHAVVRTYVFYPARGPRSQAPACVTTAAPAAGGTRGAGRPGSI